MGLAIVKNLVEQQGGTISVTSKPAVGSTFTFQLAFGEAAPILADLNDHATISNSPHEMKGRRVLLVEDDKLSQKVVCIMLQKWGIVVEVAENGRTAIAKLKTASYHAVLMDIQIPGLDGYRTTEYIRKKMKEDMDPVTLKPKFSVAVCLSLMVFYALALQCASTIAVVYKETKTWKWPALQFALMSITAYVASWVVFTLFK